MIIQETGLANVILKGNTVILDFIEEDGKHKKKYHRYRSRERAEYYFEIFGKGHNCYVEN